MLKTVFSLALGLAATSAHAASYPNYFGTPATFKLVKGTSSCPSQMEARAYPSTGLLLNGQEIGREVFTSSGWMQDQDNPFGKGVGLIATAEIRSEPCNRTQYDCSGSVRTDERTILHFSEDLKKMAIERRIREIGTGGFLASTLSDREVYKCQYKQVR
jgi:hypothetical protein